MSRPPGTGRAGAAVLAVAVAALALVARLVRITTSYEVHVDEASYVEVADSLAHGRGLSIYGAPFHLHPPGWFAVLALLVRVLGLRGGQAGRLDLVVALRPFEAVVGAATCAVLVVLLLPLVGRLAATAAGAYLALDPFAVRFDARVFLEAPAMLMALTTVTLVVAAARGRDDTGRAPPRGRLLVAAGLAAGAAVLTKETYALIAVGPVVLLLAGRGLRRRDAATVVAVAAACYASYVVGIAATGQWGPWWAEKGSGLARLVGAEQPTGFNAPGSVPVTVRLGELVGSFGPTYLVIALGAAGTLAGLLAELRAGARRGGGTVVTAWALCAYAYVGLAVVGGTLEEQTFHLVLVPGLVAAALWLRAVAARGARAVRTAVVVAVVVALGGAAATWTVVHTREDDGYQRLAAFADAELPAGTRVAVTEDTAQFLLTGLDLSTAGTPAALERDRAQYVLVSTTLVQRGYGTVDAASLATIEGAGRMVFCAAGPTLGELRLYALRERDEDGRPVPADLPTVRCPAG